MSKRTYIELSCDTCGCAEHFSPTGWKEDARFNGWIIAADGKHYDSKECYKRAKQPTPPRRPLMPR